MPLWEDTTNDTDKQTRPRGAAAINILLFLNIAGFIATAFLTRENADSLAFLEFSPRSAIGGLKLWQFLTYPFVQIISLWFPFAFIPAAYGLYTLGADLEGRIGPRRVLLFYFAFAAYGALAHGAVEYLLHSPSQELRALGLLAPVYGLLLLAALRFPERPLLFLFVFPMRTLTGLLLMGVVLVAFCAVWFSAGLAPILGAAAAAVAVDRLEPRIDRGIEGRKARLERERFLAEVEIRRQVDVLLEKIGREGMASLTRSELRTLRAGSEIIRRERVGGA